MVEKTEWLSEGDGGLEEDLAGEVFIPEARRPTIDLAKYTLLCRKLYRPQIRKNTLVTILGVGLDECPVTISHTTFACYKHL